MYFRRTNTFKLLICIISLNNYVYISWSVTVAVALDVLRNFVLKNCRRTRGEGARNNHKEGPNICIPFIRWQWKITLRAHTSLICSPACTVYYRDYLRAAIFFLQALQWSFFLFYFGFRYFYIFFPFSYGNIILYIYPASRSNDINIIYIYIRVRKSEHKLCL